VTDQPVATSEESEEKHETASSAKSKHTVEEEELKIVISESKTDYPTPFVYKSQPASPLPGTSKAVQEVPSDLCI